MSHEVSKTPFNALRAKKLLILILFLDAGIVFILQLAREPMAWLFIVAYWGILTIKNWIDWETRNGK